MKKTLLLLKIAFYRLTARPHFIIKIEQGKLSKVQGVVKHGFITHCADITERHGIQYGVIYGVAGKFGHIVIKTSSRIPAPVLQALRNAWLF